MSNREQRTFTFDPTDRAAMRKLMDENGNGEQLLFGANELGEDTQISVFSDRIIYTTFQQNGWTRRNVYWHDGTSEELYDGRWR